MPYRGAPVSCSYCDRTCRSPSGLWSHKAFKHGRIHDYWSDDPQNPKSYRRYWRRHPVLSQWTTQSCATPMSWGTGAVSVSDEILYAYATPVYSMGDVQGTASTTTEYLTINTIGGPAEGRVIPVATNVSYVSEHAGPTSNRAGEWQQWVHASNSAVTVRYDNNWNQWVAELSQAAAAVVPQLAALSERMNETAEAARRAARLQEEAARLAEQQAQRITVEAMDTARRLLLEHLDDTQREEFELGRGFHVRTPERKYFIAYGYAGNVYELDVATDMAIARLCCHAWQSLPNEDHMLIQKLMLETDELEFRRQANFTRLQGIHRVSELVA